MTKFCVKCGAELEDDAEFCTECGNSQNGKLKPVNRSSSGSGRIRIRNFVGENDNISVLDEKGPFKVIEYEKDLSVYPSEAVYKYFSSKMNIRPRQLVVDLSKTSGI